MHIFYNLNFCDFASILKQLHKNRLKSFLFTPFYGKPWQFLQNQTQRFGGYFMPTHFRWNHSKHESQHKLLDSFKFELQLKQNHSFLSFKTLTTFFTTSHASKEKYFFMVDREMLSSKHFIGTSSGRVSTWCSSISCFLSEWRMFLTISASTNQLSISKNIKQIWSLVYDD